MITDIIFTPEISSANVPTMTGAQTMSSREIAALTGKTHKNIIRDIDVMILDIEKDGSNLIHQAKSMGYVRHKDARGYTSSIDLTRDLTYNLVLGYDAVRRLRVVQRWIELEGAGQKSALTIPKSLPEALRLAADQAEQIATLEPKALAFDSLINNGELPSLRTFFKQFHELNLNAISETLGELGYLRRSDRYAGQWEVRRSHPRAAELFRQRVKEGLRWNQITILLTPQGQEEMARLYRQGAFPKLVRFTH